MRRRIDIVHEYQEPIRIYLGRDKEGRRKFMRYVHKDPDPLGIRRLDTVCDQETAVMKYLYPFCSALSDIPDAVVDEAIETIKRTRVHGKVIVAGNGGSSAIASHLAGDLMKGTSKERNLASGIPAICLSDNIPLVTAWSNDDYYGSAFVCTLRNLINNNDVLVLISSSGNSENLIYCAELANSFPLVATIGILGGDGGKLKDVVDIPIVTPGTSVEMAECVASFLCHVIAMEVKK